MKRLHDYIVIGSGAGGAAAAARLAETGRTVLVIEKGKRLPRDGSTLSFEAVLREGRFRSREPWRDRHGRVFAPQEYYNLGGKTKWYGAALFRFDASEFGADPAFGFRAWPIRYADLAPYYAEAETRLGVRTFEPEADLRRIVDAMRRVDDDWSPAPVPLGLAAAIADDPVEATRFDGFASVKGYKADAETKFLAGIEGRANVTIVTGETVVDLVPAANDPTRIAGVACASGTFHAGRSVLLAAGALSSPRLVARFLDRSGLASRLPATDHVGRHYKRHHLTAVVGFGARRLRDRLRKTLVLTHPRFPHSSAQPLGASGEELVGSQLPAWAPRFIADVVGGGAYGFFLQTEDGSSAANRVVAGSDPDGLAVLDVDEARTPASSAEHRRFVRAFAGALLRSGMIPVAKPVPLDGTAHACGTLVAGSDPAESVVGSDGRIHGLDNLYVIDGSVLPRSSRVNPALTIYAWGLRVADLLARRTVDDTMAHETVLGGVR